MSQSGAVIHAPSDGEVITLVGRRGQMWSALVDYLAAAYEHEPVFTVEGKDRSWCFRYRRGGKTLVTLYPRQDDFTVLMVLGKEEVTAAATLINRFSARVRKAFTGARQYPDGRWLWIQPAFRNDIDSIVRLMAIKRRPKPPTGKHPSSA